MPINNQSLNKELHKMLKVRGFEPVPKDSTGETSPVPDEADVFKFTFKSGEESKGTAYATIDGDNTLTLYYGDDVTKKINEEDGTESFDLSWTGFLKNMKMWAQRHQMGFELQNKDHLHSDMAQRNYTKKQENMSESAYQQPLQGQDMDKLNEGYFPNGKLSSYNDNIPTVKIVLQHTRQIQEGEQRYRNVARIYLENLQGERILAPTIKPGIAQIYARHLAEGGVPNDERWNHIKSLCEEYSKMAGFVRAVRGNQFNESAQRLVEAGLNHYTNLRETLGKMRGQRGYNAYFESWTPTLMENESDTNTLNELFVQETLDPRIESVMPILQKLSKSISEVKEIKELEEWADKLTEAPGAETLAHNQSTAKSNLKAFDLEEDSVNEGWFADTLRNVGQSVLNRLAPNDKQLLLKLQRDMGVPTTAQHGKPSMARTMSDEEVQKLIAAARKVNAGRNSSLSEEEVEESGLQAYLGNKKYGKEGMDALRKAGRDGASKEKMAKIRAKVDENQSPPLTLSQLYDPNLRPSPFPYQDPISKRIKQLGLDDKEYADLVYKVGDILARQTRVPNPYADSRKWSPGQAGTTIAKLDPRPTKEELKQAISTGKLSTRLASATALEYERQTGRPWVPEFTQGVAEGSSSGRFQLYGIRWNSKKTVPFGSYPTMDAVMAKANDLDTAGFEPIDPREDHDELHLLDTQTGKKFIYTDDGVNKKWEPIQGKQGVAEGYILKKTKVEKTFTPGDPDEYYTSGGADVTRKDTDYEIINNKTGQVVGTASWTTNDYFGPGALKITMNNGATRWLDIYPSEKGNPQTAFNRFVKDPKTAKKYKEQGVAEGVEVQDVYNSKGVFLGTWDGKQLFKDRGRDSIWGDWESQYGTEWVNDTIMTAPDKIQRGIWKLKPSQGMAEGEVIPFARKPQAALTWQQVPKDVLLLAADWFWADDEDGGLNAVLDPEGYGNGTANEVRYIAAKLQQKGWTIEHDFDDNRPGQYNMKLTNKRGQSVLLPWEDAQDFTGWAAGTQSSMEEGVVETKVNNYKDMGATKDTTHFVKNITTGKIVSPHRSKQDAEDALIANMRDSKDEFKIVRARKESVAEDLDANQKRVGQLGPTEKVGPKGPVGKYVGVNESVEHDPLQDIKRLLGK